MSQLTIIILYHLLLYTHKIIFLCFVIQTLPPWPPFMVFVTLKRLFINSLACVCDGIYAISISNKIFIFRSFARSLAPEHRDRLLINELQPQQIHHLRSNIQNCSMKSKAEVQYSNSSSSSADMPSFKDQNDILQTNA